METKRKTPSKTSSAVKKRYNDKTYKQFSIALRYDSDAAIIEKLNSVPSKNDYIRQLITQDINK